MLTRLQRRWALLGVVAAIVLAHAWLTSSMLAQMQAAANGDDKTSIERMEVELVGDMALSEPPVVMAPPPVAVAIADMAPPPEPAASAASAPTPEPKPKTQNEPQAKPEAAETPASSPKDATAVADAASAPVDSAEQIPEAIATAASAPTEAAPPFEWPQATRVTFGMEGFFRGPIHGSSHVQWIRQGQNYQVHIDAYAGPRFAPIASQRWTSEGSITPKGLKPKRFESVNKLIIKSSKPKIILFDDSYVTLPTGKREKALPDVQDPASHYIQMAYEFMLDASRLGPQSSIDMPMAHSKKQLMVTYNITGPETLSTPMGEIETYRLRPQIEQTKKDEEILADIWIAPALQYLPIRMYLRIGKDTWFDFKMDKAPQQSLGNGELTGMAEEQVAPPPSDEDKASKAILGIPKEDPTAQFMSN